MITEKKGFNRRTVFYNNEFKDEIQKFRENINLDTRFDKLAKNSEQRFSLAIRTLIKFYNKRFIETLMAKSKERENGTQQSTTKNTSS